MLCLSQTVFVGEAANTDGGCGIRDPLPLYTPAFLGVGASMRGTRPSAVGRKTGGKPTVFRFDATRRSRARLTDRSRHLSLGRPTNWWLERAGAVGGRAHSRMSFPKGTWKTGSFCLAPTTAGVPQTFCDVEELASLDKWSSCDKPLPCSQSTALDTLSCESVSTPGIGISYEASQNSSLDGDLKTANHGKHRCIQPTTALIIYMKEYDIIDIQSNAASTQPITKNCLFKNYLPLILPYISYFNVVKMCKEQITSQQPILWSTKMCQSTFHIVNTNDWNDYHASSYASTVLGVVILSVHLSVHPYVCHTCAMWQNQTMHCGYFDTTWKGNHSRFLTPTVVDGWCPFCL